MRGRMAIDVVGRDEELSALSAFFDRHGAGDGPLAIALEGEAGIGKSTLWRAAVEDARGRGLRVLSTRPAESERALAHVGLGDLLDGVLDDTLPALTPPQRRALEVALLVEDAEGGPVDQRALGVAVRSALELLADDGLVLAIDDLQWLDASSANALGFALRRLPESDITLVWTRRLGEPEQSTAVGDALEADRIERLRVGPLSVGATHQVLRSLHAGGVPRPTLLRLHAVSGGNPFYALELARALGTDGTVRDPTQPLPVPERLEELVSARLDGFEDATHEVLVLASADARLTPAQLAGAGIEPGALDPAFAANVIELAGGSVRFTHPLLASVLYQGLPAGERQRVHGRLAEITEDPLARARHLALSTDRPDAELAALLEAAAGTTAAQGAPMVSAELGEHAMRLTPPEHRSDLDRRAAAAARSHLAAGDVERGRALAAELAARAAPGAERAEALVLLAEAEDMPLAVPLLKQALLEPGAPAALRASIHQRLSLDVRFLEGLDAARGARACGGRPGRAGRRRGPARVGARRARPDPAQRRQARGARARRAGVRARPRRRRVAGRRGRGFPVRARTPLVGPLRPCPRPPREPPRGLERAGRANGGLRALVPGDGRAADRELRAGGTARAAVAAAERPVRARRGRIADEPVPADAHCRPPRRPSRALASSPRSAAGWRSSTLCACTGR